MSSSPPAGVGLDFGTTNSVLTLADPDGAISVVRFAAAGGEVATFRSVLHACLELDGLRTRRVLSAGPTALAAYFAFPHDGRLIQSIKSFLASPGFTETNIFGKTFTLEAMIARIIEVLRAEAEARTGPLGPRVTVGRPVNFVGDPENAPLAERRLRDALAQAGFTDARLVYEPLAAAYHYCRALTGAETILVGDFGGGTSDFSLLRVTPGGGDDLFVRTTVLGIGGVGIAGDAFDRRIVRHAVAPALGVDARHRTLEGTLAAMPQWLYGQLESWHHASFLNTPKTLALIESLARTTDEPERVAMLRHLVANNLFFDLSAAVERTKVQLSSQPEAVLSFERGPVRIERRIAVDQFERWIEPDLTRIAACVDGVLAAADLAPASVSRVFLTGGSCLVPAVRRIFTDRFDAERVVFGDALLSVAQGLALIARG